MTLMDNSSGISGTKNEHGLSFLIEKDGRLLLFDTGKSGTFLENARHLGADIAGIEVLVISHGHYDHGGGVREFIKTGNFTGPLWTGPDFFEKKWKDDKKEPRYLGVDFDGEFLEHSGVGHFIVKGDKDETVFREILPGIFAVNGFPRIHPEERPNPLFVVDREGHRIVDDFRDEICLAVDMPEGTAVVMGCAHPGLMNMLDSVRAVFEKPLLAVFGGSHLVDADDRRLEITIDYLNSSGCRLAAMGHCTGSAGAAAMKAKLACYQPLSVGAYFSL